MTLTGMRTHISKEKQLRHEFPDMKPTQKHVKPVVVDDDDDDSFSRVGVSKTKSRQTTAEKGHNTNRSLDSTFFTVADDETSETVPSALLRYINKLEENVESQQQKVNLMKNKLHTVDEKLQLVKSNQIGEGSMCSNCHLRLGHTARNCSLYKCTDVLSCDVEKFHQNQVNRSKYLFCRQQKVKLQYAPKRTYNSRGRKSTTRVGTTSKFFRGSYSKRSV